MKFVCYMLVFGLLCGLAMSSGNAGYSWIAFLKNFKLNLNDCFTNPNNSVWLCLQNTSWKCFDEIMSNDVVPLTSTTRLVRFRVDTPFKDRFDRIIKKYGLNSWKEHILARFYKVLSTHKLQVDGMESLVTSEGRGRHRRRNHMLPAMMFGVTALGMVLVPIGFQFLAIVVGKAFLMAKLALILASVNGLKRIATSGINFGLYQVPEPHGYYDRDGLTQPR